MTEDSTKVGGTLLIDGSSGGILRTRRQHDGRHFRGKDTLQRLRPRPFIVNAERSRDYAERREQIEERGKRRVLHCYPVARTRVVAQQALNGVEAAACHRNRTSGDSVGRELG